MFRERKSCNSSAKPYPVIHALACPCTQNGAFIPSDKAFKPFRLLLLVKWKGDDGTEDIKDKLSLTLKESEVVTDGTVNICALEPGSRY